MIQIIKTKWHFEFSRKAEKELDDLDKPARDRIMNFVSKMIRSGGNPRHHGKPLSGNLRDLWSFRVGDYRILAHIKDEEFLVLAVHVGHRRSVYKT